MLKASRVQSSSESWMMHSESIHRYWICSSRLTSIASWNVRERPDISIPRFWFSKFASVVDDKAVSSFHRWERVMYLPDCPGVSHNFGGLLREPTSMTRSVAKIVCSQNIQHARYIRSTSPGSWRRLGLRKRTG